MTSASSGDQSHELPDDSVSCIVGIGASAGGLQALELLLGGLPNDTSMTFVVVQHLSPDFRSLMDEILARFTNIPIVNVVHGLVINPNHIYLITPNKNLSVHEGRFVLSEMDSDEIRKPIDILFRSLAQGYGRRSVAVVLSGTGSDGADGVRAVREAGGLVLVQSPGSCQFDGMPINSIATGCAHLVQNPDMLVKTLVRHGNSPTKLDVIIREAEVDPHEDLTGISLVFSLLCERHGINFADYKPSTVSRRIERRLNATGQKSITDYCELLKSDVTEVDNLYYDLLIGVTKFFRDSEAFYALQLQINRAVTRLNPENEFRIWVTGCATGEEAYSLGMLAVEAFERAGQVPRIKILATDVHPGALDKAGQGIYPANALEFLSDQRKTRFFSPIGKDRYRITSEVRRHIVFARHNVIRDPPFTRLNLVSCRNMLIYLQSQAQMTAVAAFHFALEVDGILMLGASETPGRLQEEFDAIDANWRIYRKIRNLPNLLSNLSKDIVNSRTASRRLMNIIKREPVDGMIFTNLLESYDLLLATYIRCGLLLDEHKNIIHVFGKADQYLRSSSAQFTGNIMNLLEGEFRTTIGAAMVRAGKEAGKAYLLKNVQFSDRDGNHFVDVSVKWLASAITHTCVWFIEFSEQLEEVKAPVDIKEVRIAHSGDDYETVKAELDYTKESLNATIEELEASNEELQSTNEELIASNEELQSTNEELHSVNEELYSVNAENHRKITQLQVFSDDIENLLGSTDIGTIFMDQNLRIRKFTKAATQYYNLVDHDIGREISSFTHNIAMLNLIARIKQVLGNGETVIERTETNSGDPVLVKIVSYVSDGNRTGVILNIVDLVAIQNEG